MASMQSEVLLIILLSMQQAVLSERVVKIGNDIKASTSGVDVRGATFLMNDGVQNEGILFAFSAFFRSDSPLKFQIWRPIPTEKNSISNEIDGEKNPFKLIMELKTIPSVINMREDVYISTRITELCPRVQKGDRLGIYFDGD